MLGRVVVIIMVMDPDQDRFAMPDKLREIGVLEQMDNVRVR